MLNLNLLCLFFNVATYLVPVHVTNVQVHVNFKQSIYRMFFIVALYMYAKKTKLAS